MRSVARYLDAAMTEIQVLKHLRQADPKGEWNCVKLYSSFDFFHNGKHHVAIVFQILGGSLYEFTKANNYAGFSIELVEDMGYQLIKSVACACRIYLM